MSGMGVVMLGEHPLTAAELDALPIRGWHVAQFGLPVAGTMSWSEPSRSPVRACSIEEARRGLIARRRKGYGLTYLDGGGIEFDTSRADEGARTRITWEATGPGAADCAAIEARP